MAQQSKTLSEESPSVQAHLGLLQSVIQRMATNSASSKAWCITLVSAVLVVVADKAKPQYAFIAFLPTLLFLILDAYYLGLETGFRDSYSSFIQRLHDGKLRPDDLYTIAPDMRVKMKTLRALFSFSIWPFYGTLLAMVWIAKTLVL